MLHGGHVADRRVLHVLVVLAHEHDRRLPDRGHVEGLVERADVGRPVTEEAGRDLARLPVLRGPGRPERDRQVGTDDGVRAHRPVLHAGQVHRAALAPEEAGRRGRTARRRSAPSARPGPACGCGRDTCRTCSRPRASPRPRRRRPPPGPRRDASCPARALRRTAPGRETSKNGTRPSSGTSGAGSRDRGRWSSSPWRSPGQYGLATNSSSDGKRVMICGPSAVMTTSSSIRAADTPSLAGQ